MSPQIEALLTELENSSEIGPEILPATAQRTIRKWNYDR